MQIENLPEKPAEISQLPLLIKETRFNQKELDESESRESDNKGGFKSDDEEIRMKGRLMTTEL